MTKAKVIDIGEWKKKHQPPQETVQAVPEDPYATLGVFKMLGVDIRSGNDPRNSDGKF